MGKITVSWFAISSRDEYPINIDALNEHTDKHAYIHHNDVRENNSHWHYVGHLPKNSRTEIEYIAKWAGVPSNFVEVVKSKVGILNYLDHHDEPDKVQYDAGDIVTNFDIPGFIKTENTKIQSANTLKYILDGIDNDEIVEYNIYSKVSMKAYVQFEPQIKRAFKYKNDKGNTEERDMEVWYISGGAGSGKTTFAKTIAKKYGYQCYVSSGGKNPFDDYKGEPCVILDDARPSDWKFNDFLKLTDNNTSSMVGCRYYNKHFYRCKLLIITNCEPLTTWYKGLQEYQGEAIHQLTRRFTRIFTIKKTDIKRGFIQAYEKIDNLTMVVECPQMLQRTSTLSLDKIGTVVGANAQLQFTEIGDDDELDI